MPHKINILSIVPYTFLPANTGGRYGILDVHNNLGLIANDYIITTKFNVINIKINFTLIPLFTNSKLKYIQINYINRICKIAIENNIQAIFCDHPYMAILANQVAKKLHIPWFLRSHNIESDRFKSLHKWWWKILFYYEKWAFKKATGIFTITQEDSDWAVKHYKINPDKICLIPFGTNLNIPTTKNILKKIAFCNTYKLDPNKPIIYFLATLNYYPNYNAVENIIQYIIPNLQKKQQDYQIIIIGKGLNENIENNILTSTYPIKYLRFIEDLADLFHTADVMINPMLYGGGIKTKLIEALANNINAVSTTSGACGVDKFVCNEKLYIAADNNWELFTNNIIEAVENKNNIGADFYKKYNWQNIAKNILTKIENNI